jgi:hypothetical protein
LPNSKLKSPKRPAIYSFNFSSSVGNEVINDSTSNSGVVSSPSFHNCFLSKDLGFVVLTGLNHNL